MYVLGSVCCRHIFQNQIRPWVLSVMYAYDLQLKSTWRHKRLTIPNITELKTWSTIIILGCRSQLKGTFILWSFDAKLGQNEKLNWFSIFMSTSCVWVSENVNVFVCVSIYVSWLMGTQHRIRLRCMCCLTDTSKSNSMLGTFSGKCPEGIYRIWFQ